MLCVCLPVRWFILDLLHFTFRDCYVGWAVARGGVCVCGGGGGGAKDFLQILLV